MPATIRIRSMDEKFKTRIKVRSCPRRVTGNYKMVDWNKKSCEYPHLADCAFPAPLQSKYVDLLIGIDNHSLHMSKVDLPGKYNQPIARLGPLGWTCVGPTKSSNKVTSRSLFTRLHEPTCCDINETMKKMWEVEQCTIKKNRMILTDEEAHAHEIVKNSMVKIDGKYQIKTPWKNGKPELPVNIKMAEKRLKSLEKTLQRRPDVKAEYHKVIDGYISEGYVSLVKKQETNKGWYLPHFPVVRQDKSTTKVRTVMDAAAKYDGTSLNDAIMQCPKLHTDIVQVLLRFRLNPIALVCDIRQMYLQVLIEKDDRPYFRFLWRNDPTEEVRVYEFNRVVFGKASAPFEAQFVAQQNARDHIQEFPRAAETVLFSTYMDDSMDSVESDTEAVKLYNDLKLLWQRAGMEARKWLTNSKEVAEKIPIQERGQELSISNEDMPTVKTLGIGWNTTTDQFNITSNTPHVAIKLTKRSILKCVATLYDPLGFVSPFTVVARIVMQKIWARGYDWDTAVDAEIENEIRSWFRELEVLQTITIPRCIREANPVTNQRLITFVDASESAYGAVLYARTEYEDREVTVRLVSAHAKVTPLASLSMPKAELSAAALGLHLAENMCETFRIKLTDVVFFSDSKDVLWWIRGRGKKYRPFVRSIIGEIQHLTNPNQWQKVDTKENPADICSRGSTATALQTNELYWNGPKFSLQPPCTWPKMSIEETKIPSKESHVQTIVCNMALSNTVKPIVNLDRYSTINRPARVVAWMMRFIINTKEPMKDRRVSGALKSEELDIARTILIKQAQREAFATEIHAIEKGKPINPKSSVASLNPTLDSEKVLRCDGRLHHAEVLPYETRYPVLLPRGHKLTQLMIDEYHRKFDHKAGVGHLLSEITASYWIPAAREEIREAESRCWECKKRKNKPARQQMAPLDKNRIGQSMKAFDDTSVDYAGPLTTKQGRGKARQKRWICLFTCLATRAIHLELAHGLDTDSFIRAFMRFTGRRGTPSTCTSDCGTNFVGASKEFDIKLEALEEDSRTRSLKWRFNPPGSPHFGGAHEIMVKAVKRALPRELIEADVTDEELYTVLVGVEDFLNARPITYQTADIRDAPPLTPNHFLHGRVGGKVAPEVPSETASQPRERWKLVQSYISRSWSRFLKELLPMLNPRTKWAAQTEDIKVGDVVLVLDNQIPRAQWPMGRVTEIYSGIDKHVRVAKVQVGPKVVTRSIVKLIPLK